MSIIVLVFGARGKGASENRVLRGRGRWSNRTWSKRNHPIDGVTGSEFQRLFSVAWGDLSAGMLEFGFFGQQAVPLASSSRDVDHLAPVEMQALY
jgi:hypothetical protein